VSPVEIENMLRTHQAVYEACVMGYPDKDQFDKPKAFIRAAAGPHRVGRAGHGADRILQGEDGRIQTPAVGRVS